MRPLFLLLAPLLITASASMHAQPAIEADLGNLPPGVQAPKPITSHAVFTADYPSEWVAAHEVGTTTIHYMILEDGSIGETQILVSSGSQRLDDASIAMIRGRWLFSPATRNGQPIRVWQRAKIVWQLAPDAVPTAKTP
jgi:TonB family protein